MCLGLCASPAFQDVSEAAVRAPQASGSMTYSNGIATLDASNASQGYCMIQYSGGVPKIKVQISKDGVTYTYDLNARSAYEVFPFSEGNGSYTVKVFEQVTGNQYSQVLSQTVSVTLTDQFGPFLYPNQYVNFSEGSSVVSVAARSRPERTRSARCGPCTTMW